MLAAAVLGAACAALWGWGRLAFRAAGAAPGPWPVVIAVGMAVVLSLGGVANLLRVAQAPMLDAVWTAGLAAALVGAPWSGLRRLRRGTLALLVPAVVVLGFLAATHLPMSAYNPHDDIEKYFGHVARMLQTGTVFGSPLSALGTETLGGMAWLTGILVAHAPVHYYGAVDGIFGLFLCLMLAAFGRPDAGRAAFGGALVMGPLVMGPLVMGILAQVAIVAVTPQITNAAPFYLGVAALMALNMLALGEEPWTARRALLPGLLYAGLVALKPTFGLPAALHLAGYAGGLALCRRDRREAVIYALAAGGWAALFVAPWVLLHLPHYLGPWMVEEPLPVPPDPLSLFETKRMFLGGTPAGYLALALGIAASVLAVAFDGRAEENRRRTAVLMAAVMASTAAFLLFVPLLGPLGNGVKTHIRYAIPSLIAGWATVLVLARPGRTVLGWTPLLVMVGLVTSMATEIEHRVRQVVEVGSWMAYLKPQSQGPHVVYTRTALGDGEHERIRRAQAIVPEGVPFVAWVGSPVHLDYRRNPVYEADPAGVSTPWARWPDGVAYVVWQYEGMAVRGRLDYEEWLAQAGRNERKIARKAFAFATELERLAGTGQLLYNDGEVVVIKRP